MIVLPDTTTFDSSIRLVQLVGGATKVNMLKVCDKLDLYVSPNLKKDETAHRVAQELLDSHIEILSNLNKKELQIIDEFVKGGANTYVVRKMRKTQYKLQKLYFLRTSKLQHSPLLPWLADGICGRGEQERLPLG